MAFRPIVIKVAADASLPAFERHGEPVSIGVGCPRGAVPALQRWRLTEQRGRPVRVQTTALDRWGDGSIRWLLAEFQADVPASAPGWYALAPEAADPDDAPLITIEERDEALRFRALVILPSCLHHLTKRRRAQSYRSLLDQRRFKAKAVSA